MTRRWLLTGATAGLASITWAGRGHTQDKPLVKHEHTELGQGNRLLKIGFVSDIHIVNPWSPLHQLRKTIDLLKDEKPEIILWGGDFSGHLLPRSTLVGAQEIAKEISRWTPPLGHVAVMGNHDWMVNTRFGGFQGGKLAMHAALEQQGITVLVNQSIKIPTPNGHIWIAGTDSDSPAASLGTHKRPFDLQKALTNTFQDHAPCLLLAHEPDTFANPHSRVKLQLSGHMHGGQVRVGTWTPGPLPSRYGDRFLHGWYDNLYSKMLVTAGTGFSRLPVRVGAPAEVHIIHAKH